MNWQLRLRSYTYLVLCSGPSGSSWAWRPSAGRWRSWRTRWRRSGRRWRTACRRSAGTTRAARREAAGGWAPPPGTWCSGCSRCRRTDLRRHSQVSSSAQKDGTSRRLSAAWDRVFINAILYFLFFFPALIRLLGIERERKKRDQRRICPRACPLWRRQTAIIWPKERKREREKRQLKNTNRKICSPA